mgnify:CR=1 FL=1
MVNITELQAKAAFKAAIVQGRIPRYLYKYTSVENCLRIINEGTLWFADYHTFNDPFECNAIIDTSNTKAEWQDFLLQNGVPFSEAARLANLIEQDPARAEHDVKRIILENQNTTGFLCLTAKHDNLLMWAHYANQHEGCCVKFDLLNDVDLFYRIRAIVYDNNYIAYNYLRNHGGAFDAICHKSKDWAYEEEYRVLSFNYIGAKIMVQGTVKEVYLGCRIKDEDRQKIIAAVASTTKQSGVVILQSETDTQSYKLNFKRI